MDHSSLPYHEDRGGAASSHKRVAVLEKLSGLDAPVQRAYERTLAALKERGFTLVPVDIPTLEYVLPAYYTIATAEASANLARFTGIRYGRRTGWAENPEELTRKSRTEGLGEEVKLRILLGTYVLRSGFQDQYYIRAQKIRTAIRKDFDTVFTSADILLLPVFPTLAFPHGSDGMDQFQQRMADRFTCTANLAGLPALAFPTGLEGGLPAGMQFLAPAFCEERLFRAAEEMGTVFPLTRPEGYREDWR
jgi:aspartyl-tRNA(Asn)/glutamyl-tRNA(Gln) amidotransferase subunit A